MTTKRPTQSEVAELAGVSRVTVSLVLNGNQGGRVPISEETRQRVLEAARTLGYSPNPVAQMLARGTNQLIGVFTYEPVFPYEQDDFYFRFLSGVEREAGAYDYNVLLFTRDGRLSNQRQVYQNGMNTLRLADGAIIMGGNTNRPELASLVKENYPFVHYGRRTVPGCEIDYVAPDYKLGSFQTMQYLAQIGHRRLGLVISADPVESYESKRAGLEEFLQQHPEITMIELPNERQWTERPLVEAIRASQVTVLLILSHVPLLRVYEEITRQGLQVPTDISMACLSSFDHRLDLKTVTRLNINRGQAGQTAVRTLIRRMKGELSGPEHVWIPTELIIGETTVPPSSNI